MNDSDILTRVKNLIIDILNFDIEPDDIANEQSLLSGSLGLDSVLTLELTFRLEDEFGIEVPDEELAVELFDNVASLTEYIREKMGESGELESRKEVKR
ncbi:MAG: acyl carrier protein [Deltaproteobacteria bacterium]|nr:acyl carrier protein [Deltaproteobacteria bacterium]